jgi:hypothetical protein
MDPFTPSILGVTVNQAASVRSASILVGAPAASVYQIEYATELTTPDWKSLGTFTNLALTPQTMTVLDSSLPPAAQQRFYRLRPGAKP